MSKLGISIAILVAGLIAIALFGIRTVQFRRHHDFSVTADTKRALQPDQILFAELQGSNLSAYTLIQRSNLPPITTFRLGGVDFDFDTSIFKTGITYFVIMSKSNDVVAQHTVYEQSTQGEWKQITNYLLNAKR